METSFLLFCVIFTVVGGVPVTKDGSGWSADQKEPEDLSEDGLVDYRSHSLLNHQISANDKNSINYDEKQASFSTGFSFMYGSIPEASISEYDGYANDRTPDVHVVTSLVPEISSRQPEVHTVQSDATGHTSDHGSKSVDSNNGLLNDVKEPEDKNNRDITMESKGREQNGSEGNKLQLNKLGYGLMISFGALLIVILVGILSGTLIQMIRKFRT